MKPVFAGKGYTLLEALIAMAVISIALLAIGKNTHQQIRQAESLRQTTLAAWVADNVISESRLGLSPVRPGASAGVRHMGNQDWAWTLNIYASPDPNVLRLDVIVRDADNATGTVLQHTGFSLADSD